MIKMPKIKKGPMAYAMDYRAAMMVSIICTCGAKTPISRREGVITCSKCGATIAIARFENDTLVLHDHMVETKRYVNRYGYGKDGKCRHGVDLSVDCERCNELCMKALHAELPYVFGTGLDISSLLPDGMSWTEDKLGNGDFDKLIGTLASFTFRRLGIDKFALCATFNISGVLHECTVEMPLESDSAAIKAKMKEIVNAFVDKALGDNS
jgi:hypothetical protein